MTKDYLKPAYYDFAKPLKAVEGLKHRDIANRLNDHFKLKAGERLNVGDVRKLLSGVRSALEDARHYRRNQRILDETFPSEGDVSSDILLETSDTQKSTEASESPPAPLPNREGGAA